MKIVQSSTNRTVLESEKDFFLDGKHIRDSDLHIQHTAKGVTYLIYLDSMGVDIQSESKHECKMTLEPHATCNHPGVRVSIKKLKE